MRRWPIYALRRARPAFPNLVVMISVRPLSITCGRAPAGSTDVWVPSVEPCPVDDGDDVDVGVGVGVGFAIAATSGGTGRIVMVRCSPTLRSSDRRAVMVTVPPAVDGAVYTPPDVIDPPLASHITGELSFLTTALSVMPVPAIMLDGAPSIERPGRAASAWNPTGP